MRLPERSGGESGGNKKEMSLLEVHYMSLASCLLLELAVRKFECFALAGNKQFISFVNLILAKRLSDSCAVLFLGGR